MATILMLALWMTQTTAAVLDNDYVRVTRDGAPCARADTPGCGERVVVALGEGELRQGVDVRRMRRGDVAVFAPDQSYTPPGGGFLEVVLKAGRPPAQAPAVRIPPDKNELLHDGDTFFVFEEKLDPGDTRARHGHSQRVVIVLNATRLQQWPDGAEPLLRTQVPDDVRFNPPVVHVVKTVGDRPLRNIVIELKP